MSIKPYQERFPQRRRELFSKKAVKGCIEAAIEPILYSAEVRLDRIRGPRPLFDQDHAPAAMRLLARKEIYYDLAHRPNDQVERPCGAAICKALYQSRPLQPIVRSQLA